MNIIGIVVEYNPFHNGHLYQINKIKEKFPNSLIIIVMSSCFTQRGEISLLNKWEKTEIALNNNIDIVCELPYIYTVQSSDIFAQHSINILNNLNIDTLVFGTESNNIKKIKEAINVQKTNEYNKLLKNYLKEGLSYPTSISNATRDIIGYSIKSPNDLLALSYIKYLNKNTLVYPIKRTNDFHDKKLNNNIVSASNIRERFFNKTSIKKYVPKLTYKFLKNKKIDEYKYFELLKYKILSEDLSLYCDIDEGLDNKIKTSILISNNINELINNIKSKRYTYNKINRILNHIFIGLKKEDLNTFKGDYIRVLGFSENGQKYLNTLKKNNIKMITNFNKDLSYELKVATLYSLLTNDKDLINEEYKNKPIIK